MDRAVRKRYRQQAALYAGQGHRSMAIDPAHLLVLLTEQAPPPTPTELEKRIVALTAELRDARVLAQAESTRARTAYQDGWAACERKHAQDLERLRTGATPK